MTHCSTANAEKGDTRRTQVRRGQTLYFHFQESAFRSKNTPGASAEHSGGPFKQDHEQVKRGAEAGRDHRRNTAVRSRTSGRVEAKFGGLSR